VGEEAVESRSADAGVLPDLENAADWPLEEELGDELRG
jgi:hypothetical protein